MKRIPLLLQYQRDSNARRIEDEETGFFSVDASSLSLRPYLNLSKTAIIALINYILTRYFGSKLPN